MSITRREFLKGTAAGALSLTTLGLLSGCGAKNEKVETVETQPTPAASDNTVVATTESKNPNWLGEAPAIKDSDIKETWNTDLLIVGGGNGGLMAGAVAASLGIDFRIAEQNAVACETRHWYGAVNTSHTKEAGLEVDVARLRSEYSRYASGKIDQRVFNVWANESKDMHEFLRPIFEEYGFNCAFETNTGTDAEHESIYFRPAIQHFWSGPSEGEYAGWSRNTMLEDYITKKGYGVNYNLCLEELVVADGKVTGAIFQNTETKEYVKILSENVLMATGGYPGNPEMMEALSPLTASITTACSYYPSDKGQGIKAALWAGAAMDVESAPMIFDRGIVAPGVDAGYVTDANGKKVFPGTIGQFNPGSQPFMKVNRDGVRFANEHCPYNDMPFAASLQKGHVYAMVFDSNIAEDVVRFNTLGCSSLTRMFKDTLLDENGMVGSLVAAGLVKKADTIEDLADQLGFEGKAKENFIKSVDDYNRYYDNQCDEEFGKPAYTLSEMRKAPFYGCWLGASLLTTGDGIRINENMQAIRPDGTVLEGLYATGDCSGSMFANNYPELFPGVACGRTLTFAKHAVEHMVASGMATGKGSSFVATVVPEAEAMTADGLNDGSYSSTATGINGDIPVTVTIKDGKITDIQADYSGETPNIGGVNGDTIVQQIKDANGTVGVDTISGATITTEAILKAVNQCLAQAR